MILPIALALQKQPFCAFHGGYQGVDMNAINSSNLMAIYFYFIFYHVVQLKERF